MRVLFLSVEKTEMCPGPRLEVNALLFWAVWKLNLIWIQILQMTLIPLMGWIKTWLWTPCILVALSSRFTFWNLRSIVEQHSMTLMYFYNSLGEKGKNYHLKYQQMLSKCLTTSIEGCSREKFKRSSGYRNVLWHMSELWWNYITFQFICMQYKQENKFVSSICNQ